MYENKEIDDDMILEYLTKKNFHWTAYLIFSRPDREKPIHILILEYMLTCNNIKILNHYKYFVNIIPSKKVIKIDGYCNSNTSILKMNDNYIINVRQVNYILNTETGQIFSEDGYIKSENECWFYDQNFKFQKKRKMRIIKPDDDICVYKGIEDIKLIKYDNKIFSIGTIEKNKKLLMNYGEYDIDFGIIEYKPIYTDFNIMMEKNWSLFEHDNIIKIIYRWNPYIIGKICNDKFQVLSINEDTKYPLLKHLKGSSNGYRYEDEIWFIAHIHSEIEPRDYYHICIRIDSKTLDIKKISPFFKLGTEKVEFVLGLIIEKDEIFITYTQWDRNPVIAIYDKCVFDFIDY